jgi:hypothetical protein
MFIPVFVYPGLKTRYRPILAFAPKSRARQSPKRAIKDKKFNKITLRGQQKHNSPPLPAQKPRQNLDNPKNGQGRAPWAPGL